MSDFVALHVTEPITVVIITISKEVTARLGFLQGNRRILLKCQTILYLLSAIHRATDAKREQNTAAITSSFHISTNFSVLVSSTSLGEQKREAARCVHVRLSVAVRSALLLLCILFYVTPPCGKET